MKFHAAIIVMMGLGAALPTIISAQGNFRGVCVVVVYCIVGYITGAIMEHVR